MAVKQTLSQTDALEAVALCAENHVHTDALEHAAAALPAEERLYDLAELYKTFGDTTRIKILYALMDSELCVCDIAALVGTSQSAISHQLKILKQARLVRFRREGKSVLYALDDDHVHTILAVGMNHISE